MKLLALLLLMAAEPLSIGKQWWQHILYLADDKLEGRETGSPGHRRAAEYIAGEFERSGLKPAGDSSYIQPVKLRSRRIVEEQSTLALVRNGTREPLQLGEDCAISMRSEPPVRLSAPLVFVGYGLVIPEMKYDELAGIDLRGKIAVHVGGGPPSIPGPLRAHYQSAAERAKLWQRVGAVGAIALNNPRTSDLPWSRISGARLQPSISLAD